MRSACCSLLFLCFSILASAQKVYFVYLETESSSPFYVKLGDKIFSSSAPGYLVLSGLSDSTYQLSIGFPSVVAESRFTVPLQGKDRGFLIRNNENRVTLTDIQTSSVIRPVSDRTGGEGVAYETRTDDFSVMLSKAAKDPGLLMVAVVQKSAAKPKENAPKEIQKKEETVAAPITTVDKDTTAAAQPIAENQKAETLPPLADTNIKPADIKTTDTIAATISPEIKVRDTVSVVNTEEVYQRSVVKKHSESSTSEGFGLVYYDSYSGITDTVTLIIPNPRFVIRETETATDSSVEMLDLKKDSVLRPVSATKLAEIRYECKAIASEADFLKLRKNMAAKNSDEAMVDEAKKTFKSKCFTTEQVRNLGNLFLTSAGKYLFYDAAFLHVTDRSSFTSLESEIRDAYYLKRFKALVGE